ncbi:cell wall hydrolase [Bosea sp. 2RAB26]|uniref:cell wall hydrolase n=1 Tax=Bosea sp. 2RAB26 TaxID=3237476 RepID=UPI003F9171F3
MAFQIMPLQISQRQTDYGQLGTLAGKIGEQFTSGLEAGRKLQETAQKQQVETKKQELLGRLTADNPDYDRVGRGLMALGAISDGATVMGLGGKVRQAPQRVAGRANAYLGSHANAGVAATARGPALRQGAHVALTPEDEARLERATGMVTTDADRDAIVRTVYGEADRESPEGQRAVAAVIRNRANQAGFTPEQITQQNDGRNWQFEPWGDPDARARMEAIPQRRFDQIAGTVAPVIEQGLDPTGGATHFYAPKAQAALRRPVPRWDDGTGTDLGNHRFFAHGYGPGGGAPAPSAATIIAQGGGEGPPVQAAPTGGGGVYAGVPEETLQAFLNNPRVPDSYRTMIREELAGRGHGGGNAPPPVPHPGDLQEGYRFRGGDPSSPENWERVD